MAEFQFVDTSGALKTTTASSAEEAIATAPNIAPTSGVQSIFPKSTSTAVADSSTARAEVTSLKDEIDTVKSTINSEFDSSDIESANTEIQKSIQNQRNLLAERRAAEVAAIEKSFADEKINTEKSQNREFAGRSTGLITSGGGFLGTTQSHEGVLQNLRETHRQELSALDSKKLAAIEKANNAFSDRDFQLARDALQEAKNTAKEIADARATFAKNQLDAIKAAREERADAFKFASDRIEILANANVEPSSEDLTSLSRDLGVPVEAVSGMILSSREIINSKNEADKYTSIKKLADVLAAFPKGTIVPIGNGETMTAFGSSSDFSINHITDENGNVRQISTNKLTGERTITNLGAIGKAAGSSGTSNLFVTSINPLTGKSEVRVDTKSKAFTDTLNYAQTLPDFQPGDATKLAEDTDFFLEIYYSMQDK